MTASASLGWVVAVIVDRGGECRYPWIGASNCQGSGCQWVDGSPWSYAGPVSSAILSVITIISVIASELSRARSSECMNRRPFRPTNVVCAGLRCGRSVPASLHGRSLGHVGRGQHRHWDLRTPGGRDVSGVRAEQRGRGRRRRWRRRALVRGACWGVLYGTSTFRCKQSLPYLNMTRGSASSWLEPCLSSPSLTHRGGPSPPSWLAPRSIHRPATPESSGSRTETTA